MENKMFCPFCGAELMQPHKISMACPNEKCKLFCEPPMLIEVWQALISGKKAQDALSVCHSKLNELARFYLENGSHEQEIVENLLTEIASITKGDKK